MAGRGISIDILSNVRDALRGVGDVDKALSDVDSTLEDMDRSGDKSTDKMSRGFRDLAKAADRSADQIKDDYRAAYRDVRSSSDDAIDQAIRKQQELGDAGYEVGSELRQNLGETLSSFRGDLEDLPQIAQDTLGGLAGSGALGGIVGLAATVAGAAGLGLIVASIEKQNEEAERLKGRLSEAYSAAAEAGRDYLDTAQIIANAQDLMFNTERAEEWKTVQETQKQTGLDMSTILQANAGDLEAQATVIGTLNSLFKEQGGLIDENGQYTEKFDEIMSGVLPELLGQWESLNGVTKENADISAEAQRSVSDLLLTAVRDAETATRAVDEFGNQLIELPSGEQIVIDAETGRAHQNLERFKGDADGVIDSLNGRQIALGVRVDDAQLRTANRYFDDLKRKADQGISVNMRTVNGRQII